MFDQLSLLSSQPCTHLTSLFLRLVSWLLLQFDYTLRRKGVEKMIAVVMEKSCRNPRDWAGAVGGKLGGLLYIDLSEEAQFDGGLNHLIKEIEKVTSEERVVGQTSSSDAVAGANDAAETTSKASLQRAESGHIAPRKLSSNPALLKGREEAVSLGLVTLLEQAGVEASPAQLEAGASFCASEGALSIKEVAMYGKVGGLLTAMGLKPIPQEKAREALEALAPHAPRRRGSCCSVM